MTRPHTWACGILIVGALLCAGSAPALDPGPKCQSAKNKDAGKYAACRQKAEAGLVKTGDATKYAEAIAKCDAKFFDKWAKAAETAGAGTCPDGIADPNTLTEFITEHSDAVATALAGGGLPLGVGTCNVDLAACLAKTCGNGVIDPNEDCDWGNLNGGTCLSEGFDLGTLGCVPGTCTYDTSGCANCADVGGVLVGGACWYLASVGNKSCDSVCASKGLACDLAATRDYAGSGGTLTNCHAVIDALDPDHTPHGEQDFTNVCSDDAIYAIGCALNVDTNRAMRLLTTSYPTSCEADGDGITCDITAPRACACK
jgi:hypothetical protein